MKLTAKNRAFTLVEIMVVVLIVGILLAIAVPNFVRARESSRTRSCIANLRQIEGAKEQWALDNKKGIYATPTKDELTPKYIKNWPVCPDGDPEYTIGDMSTDPVCSHEGHALPK